MQIIGYNITPEGIFNSRGESRTEPPYLDWLLEQSDAIQIVYDVDYNFSCLMKLIGLEPYEAKKLLSKGRVYLPPGYTIKYFPEKSFIISLGKWQSAHFSDAGQYIPGHPVTEKGVEHIAYDVGVSVYQALTEIGLHPQSLTSPINSYRKEVMSQLDIPTFHDIPEGPTEYAMNCCKGGWVECFSKGHYLETWDYDINSAYPFFASMLPNLRQGQWVKHRELTTAKLGFVRARVKMDAQLHPVMYKTPKRMNYNPVGEWEEFLTLKQAHFIRDYSLGEVEVIDAWVWLPSELPRQPLIKAMYDLYEHKLNSEGIKREVVKRIMVGIYGSFLQWFNMENKPGPFYNPVFGAEIETNTRLKIAETCLDHKITPLHVAVDGFLTDKPLALNISPAIGAYKLASHGPAIVFGTGAVAMTGAIKDFSLDYDDLLSQLQDNPQAKSLTMKAVKPLTLGKALQQNKWSQLGEFEETTRSIDLTWDSGRVHRPQVKNAEEFLKTKTTSYAWDISIIGGVNAPHNEAS